MGEIYNAIFYKPIFNLLIFIFNVIPGHDIGAAIILLTVVIKAILWPVTASTMRSQKALSRIQPKMEELKKQYANDKEGLAKATMELYSKEKVSPFSACLPTLIQLPVFIALYQSLSHGLKSSGFENLYPFITNPGMIQPRLFGLLDLSVPNIAMALLAGVSQFFQAKMMVTSQQPKKVPGAQDEAMLATMNKQMVYMMPVLTVVIAWKLPGGLALYWLVMNLLTVVQQYYFFRKNGKQPAVAAPAQPAA
jgi:YidC/Oxa1 family membrane protein insertase